MQRAAGAPGECCCCLLSDYHLLTNSCMGASWLACQLQFTSLRHDTKASSPRSQNCYFSTFCWQFCSIFECLKPKLLRAAPLKHLSQDMMADSRALGSSSKGHSHAKVTPNLLIRAFLTVRTPRALTPASALTEHVLIQLLTGHHCFPSRRLGSLYESLSERSSLAHWNTSRRCAPLEWMTLNTEYLKSLLENMC